MSLDSGLVLLDKPAGLTSFAALGAVKRALPGVRVGHTGTLDSFATGLMIAVTGTCTRLAQWFTVLDKEYRAVIRFGAETSTLDPEGEVIAESGIPAIADINARIPDFIGPIMQAPPAISAVHIDGERAWKRARRGEKPVMETRPVTIHSMKMESLSGTDMTVLVRCSSGTYIRSLARDLALACGARAHVVALRRLSVGPFSVAEAVGLEYCVPGMAIRSFGRDHAAALGFTPLSLHAGLESDFRNGRQAKYGLPENGLPENGLPENGLPENGLPEPSGRFAAFAESGAFLGFAESLSGNIRFLAVMPS